MDEIQSLREHIVKILRGGQAFDSFEEIVRDFPTDQRGIVPAGAEHSAWQVLEHMRIAQRDILDFIRNEDGSYKEMNWPDDYWPKAAALPDTGAWDRSVAAILADRQAIESIVSDANSDLFTPFPWGTGQTLLHEALLVAEHAAYHIGQIVIIRETVSS